MEVKPGGKKSMVVVLSVLGMVCWGIAPIFAKLGLNNVNPMVGLAVRTMLAAGLVVGWAVIGGMFADIKAIPLNAWIFIAMEAILATLVGDLAYYAAIKSGEVSLVTVIMSSSPLVTILFAVLFLGEKLSLIRIVGAAFIVLGIALVI